MGLSVSGLYQLGNWSKPVNYSYVKHIIYSVYRFKASTSLIIRAQKSIQMSKSFFVQNWIAFYELCAFILFMRLRFQAPLKMYKLQQEKNPQFNCCWNGGKCQLIVAAILFHCIARSGLVWPCWVQSFAKTHNCQLTLKINFQFLDSQYGRVCKKKI